MLFAVIILFITIILVGINFELSSSQILNLSISGVIGLVIGDTFLFKAFTLIGTRHSMMVMSFTPAISAILAFFFLNEQISLLGIVGMIITLAGIILVIFDKKENGESPHKHEALGILYGVLGALGQAVGLIFAKLAFEETNINGFVATFVRLFSATIIIIPIFILLKRYKNPIALYKADKKGLGLTLGGTFFGPFLGITLSLVAISNTSVGIASTLMATVPVIMLPIGKFIFKDQITIKAVIGAVIAVAGVAILFLR